METSMHGTEKPATRSRIATLADAFATPLRPSHYLSLLAPLGASHELRARVESVRDETADARTLTLRPGRGWRRHRAGQFVRIGVSIRGVCHFRTYSISSSPDAPGRCIEITVKAVDGGRVSPFLVRHVRPGTYLRLGLPQGDFVLPEGAPVRPLFITGGSGITPVMSMLRASALRGELSDAVHVHYAPRLADVIFADELRRMAAIHRGFEPHVVATREGPATRRFSGAALAELCPDWPARDVWACGPLGLLAAVEAHWKACDLDARLRVERFRAARVEIPADAAGGRIRFAASGREIQADASAPILLCAEDAGLRPPNGCRMGICHTCDATLISGCVRDLRTGALRREPGQKVQLCVSAAAGDAVIDA